MSRRTIASAFASAKPKHSDVAEAWPTVPQRDFDASLRCAICAEFYAMPVTFRACQHAFCSDCARRSLPTMHKCPTCREPAEESDLVPAKALEEVVERFKKIRDELLDAALTARTAAATKTSERRAERTSRAKVARPVIEQADEFEDDGAIVLDDGSDDDGNGNDASDSATDGGLGTSPTAHRRDGSDNVACPVCCAQVPSREINSHLNSCLVRNEPLSSPGGGGAKKRARSVEETTSTALTRRLPKLAYHVFTLNKIRELCKKEGLASNGDKKMLEARHKEFTTRVNSIIGYGRVPDLPAIAREVNREEARKVGAGAKARMFNTVATSREKATAAAAKTSDATFARLIEEVRSRQKAAKEDASGETQTTEVISIGTDDENKTSALGGKSSPTTSEDEDWHDEEILPLSQAAPRWVPTDDEDE